MKKRDLIVVGLNSGTSADGIDLAALRLRRGAGFGRFEYLDGETLRYSTNLRSAIRRLIDSGSTSLEYLIRIDNRLGQFYGDKVVRFIGRLRLRRIRVDAVASHGQTVCHIPQKIMTDGRRSHGSLQIGMPEQIAARSGRVVIADFRQADISLGGEGAPITTAAMFHLFANRQEGRLIVNIGGMSNYFYFPAGGNLTDACARDSGPGNSLSDGLAKKLIGKNYDRNGRLAAHGKISERLLSDLLRHPFYRSRRRSTGREEFGAELVKNIVQRGKSWSLTPCDMLATVIELTAISIRRAIRPLLSRDSSVTKLYLTGGGVHNRFLLSRLEENLPGIPIHRIDELGIPADLVEAASFAVLGEAALRAQVMPSQFGIGDQRAVWPVSGRIMQPPVKVKERPTC